MKLLKLFQLLFSIMFCITTEEANIVDYKVIKYDSGSFSVDITKFPFMASIQLMNTHFCGGVIISKYHVLTLAHCVINGIHSQNYVFYKIEVGITSVSMTNRYDVEKMIQHPNFDIVNGYIHDVGIIVVKEPFKLSQRVMPIQFTRYPPNEGEKCEVIGWSRQEKKDSRSKKKKTYVITLQGSRVTLSNANICYKTFGQENQNILEKQNSWLCVMEPQENGCSAYDGEAMICGQHVVGISSFGVCTHPDADRQPTVFANLGRYSRWIRAKTLHPLYADSRALCSISQNMFINFMLYNIVILIK